MNTQTGPTDLGSDNKLTILVGAARLATEGDSNDDEILALQTALDFALGMLQRTDLVLGTDTQTADTQMGDPNDTQTEPATVPDGRLVCPHCHSGDYLGSLETSSTEYGVRLTGVGGKVEVEYPGQWTKSYDEGTEYAGDIWCNYCHQQLTESELVAYQTPQEREDAES